MNPSDMYSVVLQATANLKGETAVEAIATNNDSGRKVESILSIDQVRELLNHSYGGEAEVVDSYMEEVAAQQPVRLSANPTAPLLLNERELIKFGFDPNDFALTMPGI